MTETELRKHRCCFSGHRPEKLKITEKELARLLEVEIKRAVASGFTTYITGMARGDRPGGRRDRPAPAGA